MKYKVSLIAFIGILLAIVGVAYLEVIWVDWLLNSIFDKDVNRWLILAFLLGITAVMPEKLRGLPIVVLLIGTFYTLAFS